VVEVGEVGEIGERGERLTEEHPALAMNWHVARKN
jgi:hypothetical protein